MLSRFTIVTLFLLAGCTSTPAPRESSYTAFDRAAALVDGWFAEIHQGQPESESSLALFAWTFRYHKLTTNGTTHKQARVLTKHEADVFADVVEAEGHGHDVAGPAVGYVLMRMSGVADR